MDASATVTHVPRHVIIDVLNHGWAKRHNRQHVVDDWRMLTCQPHVVRNNGAGCRYTLIDDDSMLQLHDVLQ